VIAFVAGNPAVDRVYCVDRISIGAIHRPTFTSVLAGGKGLNAARAAHLLGAETHVVAVLGGQSGQWIEQALAAEGITGSFTWTEAETRTCVSIGSDQETSAVMTSFYERAVPVGPAVWTQLENSAASVIAKADVLCLSGSLMPGLPVDAYRRICHLAEGSGVRVLLDSHGAHLREGLEAGPSLVKINAEEAAELLGCQVPNDDLLEWSVTAAREVQGSVASKPTVLITCGPAGIAMASPSGKQLIGRLDRIGAYPVGSGDAVLGSIAVSLTQAAPDRQMLAMALAAGAANADVPGPGLLDPVRTRVMAAQASLLSI
jgi:tagatose 6-phosphate kinase